MRRNEKDLLIKSNYMNDIKFGATNKSLCEDFKNIMKKEFEMKMIGELMYKSSKKEGIVIT